jgi:hypothetical protein
MKNRSPFVIALVFLVSLSIAIPTDMGAQVGQKAGEVSRAIPNVAIDRGTQKLPAPVKALVDWGDVVNTNEGGRARVSLDDGSVLNVGSSSSLAVTQHNSAAQQTQIELTYGRMRSQVVKQSKPNAKFEVHTAVGVAGVVGTDFFLGYMNGIFQLIVFDGHVKFCNLDGVCVDVLAGQTASIRDGHQSPDQPSQATPTELTEAANATMIGAAIGEIPVHHIGPWAWVGMTVLVAIPAIVVPLATRGRTPVPVTQVTPVTQVPGQGPGCKPTVAKGC